ncbi:MAG: hypothetical protein U0237_19655 [Thermoleophilia bacterium]
MTPQPPIPLLPVTLRVRGDAVGARAARDLLGTLQATGWAATSLREPRGGPPEVTVVIWDDLPGLRDLLGGLPGVLAEWRERNALPGFEVVIHRRGIDAVRIPVGAAHGAVQDVLAGLTAAA